MTRSRRTNAQIAQLDRQILDALAEENPQSVRHVFYLMTNPRLPEWVEKSESGYSQVQYPCSEMRKAGELPYAWITDSTRRGHFTNTYAGAGDFLNHVNGLYRANLWELADSYVEVWCESRSIAGVIEDDCAELAVSLYPSGGFSSLTLIYSSAEYIRHVLKATGKSSAEIIYIGDYDPAGVLIDKDIEAKLRGHLPGVEINFYRLAINEDQIALYDLPEKPRKAGDKRSAHVRATVEAEAMPAGILRAMLRNAVEAYLPEGALQSAKVAEESERDAMDLLANVIAENGIDDVLSTVVDKFGEGDE